MLLHIKLQYRKIKNPVKTKIPNFYRMSGNPARLSVMWHAKRIDHHRSHNRGRKPKARAISWPHDMGQLFYFWNKLRHRRRLTLVHAERIFADVAQGKWRPKFPKSFILLAHCSTRLCLLEFCLSIFVVSCSSGEVRQCRI